QGLFHIFGNSGSIDFVTHHAQWIGSNEGFDDVVVARMARKQHTLGSLHQGEAIVAKTDRAVMEHEHVGSQYVAPTGFCRAHAEIVFLAVPTTECVRIEQTDLVQTATTNEHAKTDRSRQLRHTFCENPGKKSINSGQAEGPRHIAGPA